MHSFLRANALHTRQSAPFGRSPHRVRHFVKPRPFARRSRHSVALNCASVETGEAPASPISLTDKALSHLKKLKAEHDNRELLFRVGVRSGGCSGLSYIMDFESEENVKDEDAIFEYDGGQFKMICDPKSLLYLFGMQLDYSDALIGGGFQFHNPNATDTCGCGKSFGV